MATPAPIKHPFIKSSFIKIVRRFVISLSSLLYKVKGSWTPETSKTLFTRLAGKGLISFNKPLIVQVGEFVKLFWG